MITPEEFPYITSIHVNDCYAYQNFDIELFDYQPKKPFSHLILTGKNGSGKSTILRGIDNYFVGWRTDNLQYSQKQHVSDHYAFLQNIIRDRTQTHGPLDTSVKSWQEELKRFEIATPRSQGGNTPNDFWRNNKSNLLYSYFEPSRLGKPNKVETVIKDETLDAQLKTGNASLSAKLFKQYLVNRKVAQAFSQLKKKTEAVKNIDALFNTIEEALNGIFEKQLTEIVFEDNNYEFYLELKDGRRLTFDMLSEGLSAFNSILMDLFIRVDIIRKQVNDFSYNPCGVVLIDEPETHLHLELQEQVLPLLTRLFPNIQFIVATHSPAVIASVKNVTVFDVATKERRDEEVVGQSYSELSTGHLGLEDEYSDEADKILKQINEAVEQFQNEPDELRTVLKKIRAENATYISPTIEVELEILMAKSSAKAIAHP